MLPERVRRPRFAIPVLLWSIFLGCLPCGQAGMVGSIEECGITNAAMDGHLTQVKVFLAQEQVRQQLRRLGLSEEEAATRLERLGDDELRQVAQRVEEMQSGQGGLVGLASMLVILAFILMFAGFLTRK